MSGNLICIILHSSYIVDNLNFFIVNSVKTILSVWVITSSPVLVMDSRRKVIILCILPNPLSKMLWQNNIERALNDFFIDNLHIRAEIEFIYNE